MVTSSLWLSYLCPHFSVFDAETFAQKFGLDVYPTVVELRASGFFHAAHWLETHQDIWRNLRSKISEYLENRDKGEYGIVFWGDEKYPRRLTTLTFPPPFLFYRGDISLLSDVKNVAVVGARHPTNLGRLWVQDVVPELSQKGICIVSGGARGIDCEAHEAAISIPEGRTAAFLPSGVDNPYPRSHAYLFNRILNQGVLVSEFIPGTVVRAENFHRRNRLIGGVSNITVIVEAAIKSGTYMTARHALEAHRDVLVVPGPPQVASYAGSLYLLKTGASLACGALDVLDVLSNQKMF